MGMYDTITLKIKCPNCKNKFRFTEQVKWTNNPMLVDYKLGDKIDADDDEYDFATWIRPWLRAECPKCDARINYKVTVRDGILSKVDIISSQ